MNATRKKRRRSTRGSGKLALELKVKLEADPNAVDSVVQRIMKTVRRLQCAPDKDDAVELALAEALANAVVHGAKADKSKTVECDVLCEENRRIMIVVRDPGSGFAVEKVPNPLEGANILANHGRGIYLINQLMDEVQFLKNGSEIRMTKLKKPTRGGTADTRRPIP
jgi:serine/threonine-protein kinase RsbW